MKYLSSTITVSLGVLLLAPSALAQEASDAPNPPPAASAAPARTGALTIPYLQRYVPEANLWELGLFGGLMFPSSSHQLYEPSRTAAAQQPFGVAGEIGVRFAYYPLAFLGAELEAAAMPSKTEDDGAAGLWTGRGHLIGQLPMSSVTPFLLAGAGALGASSDAMGNDVDAAFHFGIGAKAAIGEHLLVRLDLRDTMSRKVGPDSGALAHSPEILIGLAFVPSRKTPDSDGDGVVDYNDPCPTTSGAYAGCPAPDTDGDGVDDEVDECVDVPGVAPSGCPDSDGDGVLDRDDGCPNVAGTGTDGCPEKECPIKDSDGDGLTDDFDRCPNEAARTLDGCPAPPEEPAHDGEASETDGGEADDGEASEADGGEADGEAGAGWTTSEEGAP